MNRPARCLLSFAAASALAAGTLTVSGPSGSAAVDPQSVAGSRLLSDSSGGLTYRTGESGSHDFVGVPAGVTLDNPAVSASTSVADAAAAHLARYGAAFGSKQPGTTLTELRSAPTVAGDVVRYQQRVGGLPVMGGELVVSLRPNRELDSILAKTTQLASVPGAKVSQADATARAQEFFQGSAGSGAPATVASVGRWVVDPALIGASTVLPTRTVWRLELTRAAEERRMMLVDDQLGAVLMDVDLINEARNRIVCDNNQVLRPNPSNLTPCTNISVNLVRTEGGAPAALPEAETAFTLGGVVHDSYQAFGGLDLTELIGDDVAGGVKALAQTVRWCYASSACPYGNAFWNGEQMYYGTGYAVADDVVGHEMTHGVTERTSGLFYWGQSGAMNESLSDIIGEIIDHRFVTAADVPATAWALAEDLPGFPTGLRNIEDPTLKGDPDRTGSALYVKEPCCGYPDGDGVHSNSGVGNKTFYLASQGGTFNGQTITGIDAGDSTLTKSAKLWLLTDQTLSSGSDYADEAVVLEQSCEALRNVGAMTGADCTAVHQATLATELRNTPVNNPQPTDAELGCPAGTHPSTLLDSETGTPATKFTAGTGWSRNGVPAWGEVAHSNPASWSVYEATPSSTSSLTAAAAVSLPAGQAAYLFFHHWRVLQGNGTTTFNDAGTVEIDAADAAALPWVNGPTQTISGTGNPANGRLGFGGDSRGYVASRVDLSSFAGTDVTPRFSFHNNSSAATFIGWFVDDIKVYTCDPGNAAITNLTRPTISGVANQGELLAALPGDWSTPGTTSGWQWLRDGSPVSAATSASYALTGADIGHAISVQETASKSGFTDGVATSSQTTLIQGVMTPGTPTIGGDALVGSTLTASPGTWLPADAAFAFAWEAGGAPIAGATSSTYQVTAAEVGKQLTVTVTGTRPNWEPASATSSPTAAVPAVPVPNVVAGAPTIKGRATVGRTLTANAGTWGPAPVTLTYQWLRNGAPIAGATGTTYKLKKKDKGKKISVTVTGSKSGFTSASATSPQTKKVTKKKKQRHHRVTVAAARVS